MNNMNNEVRKVISLYDRQEIVENVAGFYAPGRWELSEALAIIGCRDTVGIGQHFQEIYRRQQNNRVEKPENAIKAITREYIANYRSAETLTRMLGSLALDITEMYNPNISLADEVQTLRSGHRAFTRFFDLKETFKSPETVDEQCSALDRTYFSRDLETTQYVYNRLSEISVKDSRILVNSSIKDQQNRSLFWLNTLTSARSLRIAGPIIQSSVRITDK